MAQAMPEKGDGRRQGPAGHEPSRAAKVVFGLVFAVLLTIGVMALQSGLLLLFRPDYANRAGAFFAALMGAVLSGASIFYFYRAHVAGPRRNARLARIRKQNPDQPWLERPDWAARRIVHTSGGIAAGLWIWTLGWWGFLSFIAWVNYEKILRALSESWWNGALLAVFVGAGLIGLSFAIRFTAHWWRYGTSVLRLDTLPAFAGETLRATLEARLTEKPRHPLAVELVCEDVLWVTTGHGKNRSTRLDVKRLGSARSTTAPGAVVLTRAGARAKISVDVPVDLPECAIDEQGNGVRWVLHVMTTGDDRAFSSSFEVPVYARRLQRGPAR